MFRDPARAVALVNGDLCAGNRECTFVTLVLAVLDTATWRLAFIRAGHVPPFLHRKAGLLRLRGVMGLPLGLEADARYATQAETLAPEDALLIVSDGITEGAAPDGTLFDDAGVEAWLTAERAPALPSLLARLRGHEAGQPASDDVALLLLQLRGTDDSGFSATMTPGPDGIAALLDAVEAFLIQAGVDVRARHHVALGLDELLANLATHGGAADAPARLRLSVEPDHVRAELEDMGLPFDPRTAGEPDVTAPLEQRDIGGLGLFLLGQLADSIDYARREGRNVTLFRIARTAGAAATHEGEP